MSRALSLPPVGCLAACLAACGGAADPVVQHFGGPTMGSTYEVKFVGAVPLARVRAVVDEELAAFDATFSNWRADSEIARVNAHASTAPLPVSERFAAVLQLALDVAAATDGAFDPTVKPLLDAYRAAKRGGHGLEPAALAAAVARVGHARVAVRDGAVVKQSPDVALDLDGIVAGAAADAIAARLTALGVPGFYLEITGEVLCRGEKAPGVPWRIGVVDPRSDALGGNTPVRALPLRDRALCTSGDYRNAAVVDGRVVHHVFDPRTGRNPEHAVCSASVLADRAAIADAFGTALLVLGDERARELWPRLARFGVHGALLLRLDAHGDLQTTEISWPSDDS